MKNIEKAKSSSREKHLNTKIGKRLKTQQKIEGYTSETGLLFKILKVLIENKQGEMTWNSLTTVKHHKYGSQSYQSHIFYYPNEALKGIIKLAQDDEIGI